MSKQVLTLDDLRPEFKAFKLSDDKYMPCIEGGFADEEEWFDMTALDERTVQRVLLLVEAAYDMGIRHTRRVMREI